MCAMITTKIREMARKRGIANAYQLQKACGLSPSMGARLWRDEVEMIGLGTLDKLCKALECSPGDLLVRVQRKGGQKK